MVKIKINLYVLTAFIVIIFAIISAYFLISIELSNMTTTTLPETTTIFTTTIPLTTTTTLPALLREGLLGLANENIQGKCNVTYTSVERKHIPASKWFTNLCPNFANLNETEKWRTSAYLNDKCNIDEESGCIEIFTSISLDEKLICVWGVNHFDASTLTFEELTKKYC